MTRILVTGGSGFIGTHLIRHLRSKEHWVRNADIVAPHYTVLEANDFYLVDLRDGFYTEAAMDQVDWCFNLAADMGGMGFIGQPSLQAQILYNNTLINFNTLEAARERGVEHYFQASSVCVYPTHLLATEHPRPLKEEDAYPAAPGETYGWEKLQAEHLCAAYHGAYGMDTHVARFHNVYGPLGTWCGDWNKSKQDWDFGREKAPAAMCRKVAVAKFTGKPVTIWGDGETTRAFMYVEDCVRAVCDLMGSDEHRPVTLGPDRAISINELVSIVEGIAGVTVERQYVNEGYQGVRGRAFDHSRCQEAIGWVPDTPLEVGLVPTYEWIETEVKAGLTERGVL
jgi:nucleoside-diphosphate-sugar epimerase